MVERLFVIGSMMVSALLFAESASAEDACAVSFQLDTSHSALLLDILEDGRITDAEMDGFLGHPGTDQAIRKTRSYGVDVNKQSLAAQIRSLLDDEPVTDRTFALHRYEGRQDATREWLATLESNLDGMAAALCAQMEPYIPEDMSFSQEIVIVSAVNTTGFSMGDPSEFYIVAEAFNGDLPGAGDIIVHESYHAVQSALTKDSTKFGPELGTTDQERNALRLLSGAILEGTASHLADPIAAGNEGAMRSFQYRLARRYTRNIAHQFVLFDTALFRLYHDPDVEYRPIHRIGLEGNEGFYHMAALMTKAIAEADGTKSVPTYFKRSPADFFARYQEIAERSDGTYPSFSSSTRKILDELLNLDN